MLGVGWEVGLFRDVEQVLRGQGGSDPPLGVGVSGTFASGSHVSPLLVFFSMESQGNSWIIFGSRPERAKCRARPGDGWVQF